MQEELDRLAHENHKKVRYLLFFSYNTDSYPTLTDLNKLNTKW